MAPSTFKRHLPNCHQSLIRLGYPVIIIPQVNHIPVSIQSVPL